MKKIKLVSAMAIPTALISMAVSSCTSIKPNNSQKQVKTCSETSSSIFNVKDGVLCGFKPNTTLQDLKDCIKDNTLVLPDCNEIAEGAFRDTILNDAPFGTTITIPASTTTINDFAFYGNTATAVTWSGTPKCTTIGKSAFAKCSNLTTFTFPSTITSIKAGAFMGCSNIATFNCTALSSCPTLGNKSVFRGTKSSGSLTLTDSNAEAIWSGFVDAGLNSSWTQKNSSGGTISKPKTIPTDYLTYSTSTDNEGNATLTITGVNTSVCDITKFNKLAIPAQINDVNVTAIGASAFASKTSLTSVDFSSATNLTTIGTSAFSACTQLATVTIPEESSITTIGEKAFYNCTSLTTFAFENTNLVTLGSKSFCYCNLTSVTMPVSLEVTSSSSDISQFYKCTNLKTVDLSACAKMEVIPASFCSLCSSLATVKFPNSGLKTVNTSAFNSCTSLTTVTLYEGVTTINKSAFYGCTQLTTVSLPSSISTIGTTAFNGDTALTSVTFADTSSSFTVKNKSSTVISSSYLPTDSSTNAQYLTSNYTFAINFKFTYSYLNVDNAYKSTFTLPYQTSYSSITWTSSDTSIATVSSGSVTVPAGVTGTATITAKSGDTTLGTCSIKAIATNTNLTYTALTTTTASVKHGSVEFTGTVTIPSVWNSRFVTTIPSFGFGKTTEEGHVEYGTTFYFPGTLTSLGDRAFYKNNSVHYFYFQEPCNFHFEGPLTWYDSTIVAITFPKGLSSIPYDRHFHNKNYNKLKTIKLPSTVSYIYGNWFGALATWGTGSLTLDLSELTQVPTLDTAFGSSTTTSMTIKVKNSDMATKFKAAANWNDSRYTYTYDS